MLLIMRVQNARDDGTTHAEWDVRAKGNGASPDIEQVCFEAARYGFEIRPNFGTYNPAEWPLTLVFFTGSRVIKGNAMHQKYGRRSSIFAWPCRKAPGPFRLKEQLKRGKHGYAAPDYPSDGLCTICGKRRDDNAHD